MFVNVTEHRVLRRPAFRVASLCGEATRNAGASQDSVLPSGWKDRRADGRSDGWTGRLTDKCHVWRFVSLKLNFASFRVKRMFVKTNTDDQKRHKGTLRRNMPNISYYMYALFWPLFALLYSAGSGNLQKPKTVLVREWLIDCLPFICCEVKSYEKAFYWLPITWQTESTCLKNNYIP